MAGTGPTPGADSHSLTVPRSPSTKTAPSMSWERGWRAKCCLHSHLVKNYFCIPPLPSLLLPLPPLSRLWPFWQASPLAYTATTSWARERCHITPAKKHRHGSTFSRDRQRQGVGPSLSRPNSRMILRRTETKEGRDSQKCVINKICDYKHFDRREFPYSITATSAVTQTLATPTPVKRASNSSCRRGSRLCSSSIMAAETRTQIEEGIVRSGIFKWEWRRSLFQKALVVMSHGCF